MSSIILLTSLKFLRAVAPLLLLFQLGMAQTFFLFCREVISVAISFYTVAWYATRAFGVEMAQLKLAVEIASFTTGSKLRDVLISGLANNPSTLFNSIGVCVN